MDGCQPLEVVGVLGLHAGNPPDHVQITNAVEKAHLDIISVEKTHINIRSVEKALHVDNRLQDNV